MQKNLSASDLLTYLQQQNIYDQEKIFVHYGQCSKIMGFFCQYLPLMDKFCPSYTNIVHHGKTLSFKDKHCPQLLSPVNKYLAAADNFSNN